MLKINKECLPEVIAGIGAHPDSLPIFSNKASILPFKLFKVRTPAANIIKQEMLAAGGDAVTPAGTVVCAEKYVDILLLGTKKQYSLLFGKLERMQYFGIPEIVKELRVALASKTPGTDLADGRSITYEHMLVMGILNVTPDSFYEGSRVAGIEAVIKKAEQMLEDGADILDVGGESTRPGSDSVGSSEEMARVVPAIAALRRHFPKAILSVDTYRSATASAAIGAGADIINDISALEADKNMLDVVVQNNVPLILMHMRGTPKNMQQSCAYTDVVEEVANYLYQRAQLLQERGVGYNKVILDPGIGFAKNVQQNLLLMRDLGVLASFGYPVLLAASRKSTIGAVLGGVGAEARLEGTIATSLQAVYAGAHMVRVHDVKENVRAIRMLEAILCPKNF